MSDANKITAAILASAVSHQIMEKAKTAGGSAIIDIDPDRGVVNKYFKILHDLDELDRKKSGTTP